MMRLQRRNVKLMLKLKEVIRKSLRFLLFDDTCSYCHKKLDREGYICSKCLEKLKREAFLKNKDNFYYIFIYEKEIRQIISDYKLRNRKDLAKDIADFIDEKGIKEFHYIGLSVGGMLAPYLYEFKKNSMKSIIMMDSYSGEEGIEKHNLYFKLLDMIEEYQTIPQPMAVQIANMFFAKNNCNVENKNYSNFLNRLQNFGKTLA